MAKLDYEKDNVKRKVKEKGWESASEPQPPLHNARGKPSQRSPTVKRPVAELSRSNEVRPPKRRLTAYEQAVLRYLEMYARATVDGSPKPPIPTEVLNRYTGTLLNRWPKRILQTTLYAEALRKAQTDG